MSGNFSLLKNRQFDAFSRLLSALCIVKVDMECARVECKTYLHVGDRHNHDRRTSRQKRAAAMTADGRAPSSGSDRLRASLQQAAASAFRHTSRSLARLLATSDET